MVVYNVADETQWETTRAARGFDTFNDSPGNHSHFRPFSPFTRARNSRRIDFFFDRWSNSYPRSLNKVLQKRKETAFCGRMFVLSRSMIRTTLPNLSYLVLGSRIYYVNLLRRRTKKKKERRKKHKKKRKK